MLLPCTSFHLTIPTSDSIMCVAAAAPPILLMCLWLLRRLLLLTRLWLFSALASSSVYIYSGVSSFSFIPSHHVSAAYRASDPSHASLSVSYGCGCSCALSSCVCGCSCALSSCDCVSLSQKIRNTLRTVLHEKRQTSIFSFF
jgi:hypothetical protein